MTERVAQLYKRTILHHPFTVIVLLSLLFSFFIYHAKNFELDASTDSLLLENDKDLEKFRQVVKRYGTMEFLLVTFTPEKDLFSDETLKTLKSLKNDLQKVNNVDSVITLLDLPLLTSSNKKLTELADGVPTIESEGVDKVKAKKELTESFLYKEYIISLDGGTTGILINLKNDKKIRELATKRKDFFALKQKGPLSPELQKEYDTVTKQYYERKRLLDKQTHTYIGEFRAILDKYRDKGTLHLGGIPMITDDMITFIKNDLVIFGIGVFAFLVLTLSIIFRQIRFVTLPLVSCIFAGLLMVGILGFVQWKVTVISSNFISLMLILTMSMNVHLIVRYLQLTHEMEEADQADIVAMTVKKMVWPCLYTALTTIIAFGSLIFSDIKPVIDFGWMMSIGLAVTFLTTFLLFPALLVSLKKLDARYKEPTKSIITAKLAQITETYGNTILVFSVLLFVVSGIGISKLKVENSFINYFSKKTEIYQGMKLIDDKLGGTTPLDITLSFNNKKEEKNKTVSETKSSEGEEEDYLEDDYLSGIVESDPADTWFQPRKINRIKAVHDYLESIPAVGKVISLASSVRVAEEIKKGELDSIELAILYKKIPLDIRNQAIDPYISIKNNEARISLRIKDSQDGLRRNELLKKIQYDLAHTLNIPEDKFSISGILVLYNNMLQSLFSSQILSIGFVMLGISIMFLILFQSVTLSLIGIIPNILAAGLILGIIGLLGIPLDMMTITIASITIGIAVDNSIHYIYRFREEFAIHKDYIKTLHICHTNIGRAVYYTSITIIFGFSILILSNFIPTIYFGFFTALAMFTALLAVLTLLPKLILMVKPFGK
ncbi:MAG: MMPL family transporter [Nitrospinae bacterium]|nr:MMPL family transporter [Nitrospinota bacterium]